MSETISAAADRPRPAPRLRPSDLFTPEEWRSLNRGSWVAGPAMILHAYALMALAALCVWAAFNLTPAPWNWLAAAPVWLAALWVFAGRQLGLLVLMHEAAHNRLSPHHGLNDLLGSWLAGAPMAASMKVYRPYHLAHHKYTQQPADPDLGLSAAFPTTPASMRRKILRDLTGRTWLKQRAGQIAMAFHPPAGAEHLLGRSAGRLGWRWDWRWAWRWEWAGRPLTVHALAIAALWSAGALWVYWALFLPAWIGPHMLIYRVRNIAEHACVETAGEDPMRMARTTMAGPLERLIFAPYWVNYHCEHHLFIHTPCWRLKAMHELLRAKGYTERMVIAPSYRAVLREVVRAPGSPAV